MLGTPHRFAAPALLSTLTPAFVPTYQALWVDPELIELSVKSEDEPRFLVIGLIDKKHWSAVITYRGSTIRIISVRRSRKKEVKLYES